MDYDNLRLVIDKLYIFLDDCSRALAESAHEVDLFSPFGSFIFVAYASVMKQLAWKDEVLI